MEPIDISSSDSDVEISGAGGTYRSSNGGYRSSTSSRIISPDAPGPSNYFVDAGDTQKLPSARRAQVSEKSSSNGDFSSSLNHKRLSTLVDIPSNSLPESAAKRVLPSSLQPYAPRSNSVKIGEFRTSAHTPSISEKSHYSHVSSSTDQRNHMNGRDRYNSDDVVMLDSKRSRVLPPTLMHGKASSASPFAGTSDSVYRSTVNNNYRPTAENEGDDGYDERLIMRAVIEDINQPVLEAELPDGLLSVALLKHQKIALAWMLQKETKSCTCAGGILADDQGLGKTISMIALIQMQRFMDSGTKSNVASNGIPEALNLDDDDDNTNAAVVSVDQINSQQTGLTPSVSISVGSFNRRKPAAKTLVVCPASVLRQWARELDEKVYDSEESKLSVLIYHGGNRTKDPTELAKFDVVLTTYALVTNEVPKEPLADQEDLEFVHGEANGLHSGFSAPKKKKKEITIKKKTKKGRCDIDSGSLDCSSGALAKVSWYRVILDEAQTIKNHRTQVARACCRLRAKKRWCLSGTPIQNTVDDLYSYFRFLRYDPYAKYKSFCAGIKLPISRNSVQGYKKLQVLLRTVMLRRTKDTYIGGEPIINLPPKSIQLSKVDFSPDERMFYSKLEAESRSQFKKYAEAGTVSQNYANILLLLLRLRQACDHPLLVKGFNSAFVGKEAYKMARSLPRDMLFNLLNLLESSKAICRACDDPPEDAVVTMCGHVFCNQCVSESLTGDDHTCPAVGCKEQLGEDIVYSEATLRKSLSDSLSNIPVSSYSVPEKQIEFGNNFCSSKIRTVLEFLNSMNSSRPELNGSVPCNGDMPSRHGKAYSNSRTELPEKAIIFSQWTGMLDLFEMSLEQTSLVYRRLDGTMTLNARDKAVKDFNTDPEVTVMLMSLKAGNLGLNMVAACHIILLDLWWNPTTEDQAIDRAHRIGQTRPVTVSRLTIKDTVEDRILALQEEKRKMVSSAFGDGQDRSGGAATRLTFEDLTYLFRV
uniref:Helicase-like transcription factor CHR28 n=1 Tax=Kalanchoe fedtschenkoi TaxID=63787 RepID=A0A7N0TPX8_KALFE